MTYQIPITLNKTQIWYKNIKENKLRHDLVLEHEGKPLAMTGIVPNKNSKEAETYIFVNPDLHGMGVGVLAWFGCLAYAFYVSNFEAIHSITNEDNVRSIAVSEKLGFVYRGEKLRENKKRLYYRCKENEFNSNMFDFEIKGSKIYIYTPPSHK